MVAANPDLVCVDEHATKAWLLFCLEHGYAWRDMHAAQAFGQGFAAGAAFGAKVIMDEFNAAKQVELQHLAGRVPGERGE